MIAGVGDVARRIAELELLADLDAPPTTPRASLTWATRTTLPPWRVAGDSLGSHQRRAAEQADLQGDGPKVGCSVCVGQLVGVSKAKRPALSTFGWPPLQPIRTASAYVSRSRWTLYRAVARGELPVAGRRSRALVFRREDLDRWMLGEAREPAAAADPPALPGTRPPSVLDEDA